MSNQRVVVLTDDEIGVAFHPPVHRVDAQCSCDDCVSQRNLRSKLMAALEHPGGITGEMIARAKDTYNYTLVSADPWRAALEAAFFPGGDPTEVGSLKNDPTKPLGNLGRTVGQEAPDA